ncbi:MAG: methyltransferase domain-containing protein [Desulfobacterales bacterium]|jgi:FKBP-type peptidyl-prolyl cis-trans isomerase 2|nr:methyltransferase domain-containing protein [Desulfobacterales bacterium]
MEKVYEDQLVDLVFTMKWKSRFVTHAEWYMASRVNMWRDILPPALSADLAGKQTGDRLEAVLPSGDLPWPKDPKKIFQIGKEQFARSADSMMDTEPRPGRFYPKGLLKDIPGVFKANITPFRCVGVDNGHMDVDFNHPLAGKELMVSAVVGRVESKKDERGGASVDWLETLADGPGMQARWEGMATDYFFGRPFAREDETDDALFYTTPRLVQHLDDAAIDMVKSTYGRFLKHDMAVLDLMSSWQSHIPEVRLKRLSGLGLNELELHQNPLLTDITVHNLNQSPRLPYADESFDAVINTVSVEYLIDPITVFQEVGRVLKPNGKFIVTFSNRWFPPKAIRIWSMLHEFERMGLVSEYFLRSGVFHDIQTFSARGLPRPRHDKYFPKIWFADPVYAVWGEKGATT